MCDDEGGVGGGGRSQGLNDNNGGVNRGRGLYDKFEGLDTTIDTVEARQQAQGIYDDDDGVGGGRQ